MHTYLSVSQPLKFNGTTKRKSNLKMGKGLGHFSKEDTQMTNKYMKDAQHH